MPSYKIKNFPKSRIATNDVCAMGLKKHHVVAMIEIDVTESRKKINQRKETKQEISVTGWLIKEISTTIKDYKDVAAYIKGKRSTVIFNDINVSIIVEKDLNGMKVPIPLLIEKTNEKSIQTITEIINDARNQNLTVKDIVLQKKSNRLERIYYILPGFIRRYFWHYLLRHPKLAFSKMGNVSITSIGMIGKANGWFIPISIHPVCFGIGKISKKPIVVDDEIKIRQMLNITVLLDHDVIDGANMARFISKLTENIEKGNNL